MKIDVASILRIIVDWFGRFLRELASAPQIIWEWSEKSTLCRAIVFAAAAAAAAMLIAAFVSTVRTLIKKRKLSLFALLFVSALICAGMWVARGQIVVREIPEPDRVQINGEDFAVNKQYSLARGVLEIDHNYVMPSWQFVDDMLSFKVDDDSIIQLSGLRSFFEERQYQWNELLRHPQLLRLEAEYWSSYGIGEVTREQLILLVFPNVQLSEEEWYLDAGETQEVETAHFGNVAEYDDGTIELISEHVQFEILENNGDRIVALVKSEDYEGTEVCVAQQMGDDLVLVRAQAYHRINNRSGSVEEKCFAPDANLQEREYMLSPLIDLLDGRLRLLQNLTDEQMELLLPDRIVDYPVGFSLNSDHFSIPCREIIKSGYETSPFTENYAVETLQFVGRGPDEKEYFYFLFNESDRPEHEFSAELRQEKPDVDADMSEFIGSKAYIYQDGWLIFVGNIDSNGRQKQYYYLTRELAD